jgi:hypothetical protein
MMFLKDKAVSNLGKSAYRTSFLYSTTNTGQTYSQKYQALHRELDVLYAELN